MSSRARLLMFSILNLCMATAMSVTADLLQKTLSVDTLLMIFPGFALGMLLCYLIPFSRISEALCKCVHLRQQSLPGALVAGIVPALINTVVIGAFMTAIHVPPHAVGLAVFGQAFLSILRVLLPVAYAVGLLAQPLAVRAAFALDGKGRAKEENKL